MGVDPNGTGLRFLPLLAGEGQDGGERFCRLPILPPPSLTLPRAVRKGVMGVNPNGTGLRFLPLLTGEGQDGGERFCLLPILLPPSPSPAQRAREGIYEQLLKGVPFQPDPICRWPNGLRFCSQAVQYRLADGGQTFDVRYVAKFVIKRHLHFRRVDRHLETAVRRILVARRYIPANHGGL